MLLPAVVTRFCMGAAWREAPNGREFDKVLEWFAAFPRSAWKSAALSACSRRARLSACKDAGLTAYNHNLDTSPEFYGSIITTRVYDERPAHARCGPQSGHHRLLRRHSRHGRKDNDRVGLLHQLANLQPHPESVPINMLVRVEGTPLAHIPALDPLEMVRAIATARILMPASRVRLAAGRKQLSPEAVTLCFLAGANSIFVGENF